VIWDGSKGRKFWRTKKEKKKMKHNFFLEKNRRVGGICGRKT